MSYLVLPHLHVQSANALACGFLVNATPVMAVTQFAHHLGRLLQVESQSVAIRHFHAEHQALEDRELSYDVLPFQRRSATLIDRHDYVGKGSQGPTLSAQPTACCNLRLSLIIEIPTPSIPNPEAHIKRALLRGRLAGGQIVEHGEPRIYDDIDKAETASGRGGFWIVERSDLMSPDDPLASFLSAITRMPSASDDDEPSATSWLAPTVLGYLAITDFAERQGTRLAADTEGRLHPTLHAYAEPLIGIVQYRSANRWQDPLPFWQQSWRDDDTFTIQCSHAH